MDLSAEFVGILNKNLPQLADRAPEMEEQVSSLKTRIKEVMEKLSRAEFNVNKMMSSKASADANPGGEHPVNKANDIILIKQNNEIVGVASKSISKPSQSNYLSSLITAASSTDGSSLNTTANSTHGSANDMGIDSSEAANCSCPEFIFVASINLNKNFKILENENEILELDGLISEVFIETFPYTYRSYRGIVCWISIILPSGEVYLLDAIKFKHIIPRLRLLRCGVRKIVHCRKCVDFLESNFGRMGCYQNYDIPTHDTISVDWRIRPLNSVLVRLMRKDLERMAEKAGTEISLERCSTGKDENEYNNEDEHGNDGSAVNCKNSKVDDEYEEFLEMYGILEEIPFLKEVFQLRDFLASKYDESPAYVMTDRQVIFLASASPKTLKEFNECLGMVSTVVMQHAMDFLMFFRKGHAGAARDNREKDDCEVDNSNGNDYCGNNSNGNDYCRNNSNENDDKESVGDGDKETGNPFDGAILQISQKYRKFGSDDGGKSSDFDSEST